MGKMNLEETIYNFLFIVLTVTASLFGLILLSFFSVRLLKFLMRLNIIGKHRRGILLKVTLPKYSNEAVAENGRKPSGQKAEQMFAELRGIIPRDWRKHLIFRETLSFEILATATEINFFVFCSRDLCGFVREVIFANYPDADIREIPDYFPQVLKNEICYGYVRLVGPEYAPLRTEESFASDSLATVLNKMSNLRGVEMLALQYYLTPVTGSWRGKIRIKSIQTEDNKSLEKIDKKLEEKMKKESYLLGIRIISKAQEKKLAENNFNWLARSFSQFDNPPQTSFESSRFFPNLIGFLTYFRLRLQPFIDTSFLRQQFVVNTEELATLFHFPLETHLPKIGWQKFKTAPAPVYMPESGFYVGKNKYRSEVRNVYLSREDRRKHFYLIGQTGTGKTEYLKYLFLNDVARGEGACFIDPHGDAAEDLIGKIPQNRIKDTVYWNPADTEFPFGLNIMDVETIEQKNIIINSFIALLYKLYDPNRTGIMGPMLERTIRNVMLTAMEERGNTLIEALRLIISPDFADQKVRMIRDPVIKSYWTEQLAHTTDFHKSETLAYFISKFDRFVTDSTIRNIIGQSRSSVDFGQIMNEGKILIINLTKGGLGEENSAFLGMLIIPKFMVAAMERAKIAEKSRRDFYLYIDEFQNFAIPDLVTILSEARKYKLNLILANQYIAQIKKDVRDAVFGNVGTLGIFRVGVDDASYLTHYLKPRFSEYDLINNITGNLYLKPLILGKPAEAFPVSLTYKEITDRNREAVKANIIRDMSRINMGLPKNLVERETLTRAKMEDYG